MPLQKDGTHKSLWEYIGKSRPDSLPIKALSTEERIDIVFKFCRLLVDRISHLNPNRNINQHELKTLAWKFDRLIRPNKECISMMAEFCRKLTPIVDYPERARIKSFYNAKMTMADRLETYWLGDAAENCRRRYDELVEESFNKFPEELK